MQLLLKIISIVVVITLAMAAQRSEGGYVNINGPSVIRVPDWVANPLGRYYLYFAHHKGEHIRMAFSDNPTRP